MNLLEECIVEEKKQQVPVEVGKADGKSNSNLPL